MLTTTCLLKAAFQTSVMLSKQLLHLLNHVTMAGFHISLQALSPIRKSTDLRLICDQTASAPTSR